MLLELVLHLPCRRSLLLVLSELRIKVIHPGVLESREIILVELRARVEFLEALQSGHIAEHVVRHVDFNILSFDRSGPKFEVDGEMQEESGLDRSKSNIGWGRGRRVCSSTRWSVLSMFPISVTEMIGWHLTRGQLQCRRTTKNVFDLMYGNKQARSLYTGQRNLYAQAAQYIQNTAPHRTATHEWMRSPIELDQVSTGSKGENIRGRSKPR